MDCCLFIKTNERLWINLDPYDYFQEIEPRGRHDIEDPEGVPAPEGSTHEIVTKRRYHDISKNGDWARISLILIPLLHNPLVDKIWYYQIGDKPIELTAQRFKAIMNDWIDKLYQERGK